MNETQLRSLEYLLKGGFEDFKQVEETKDVEFHLSIEDEPKTFLESFTDTFDAFSMLEINESEEHLINSLNINEELENIQEALDSIREKIMQNESISELAAIALPGLATLAAMTIGAIIAAKENNELKLPTKAANFLFDVKEYIANGDSKEKRNELKAAILKKNPNINPKDVNYMIDVASKIKKPESKSKNTEYVTDFAAINKKRFNLA